MIAVSGLGELHTQCEKRGWRLRLTIAAESVHTTRPQLDALEVRGIKIGTDRELLARAPVNEDLDQAAVQCARSLERQGLIT